MLADTEHFNYIETVLKNEGTIAQFEIEYGKITGRMMIITTELPVDIDIKPHEGEKPIAFEASFDFCDCAIGIALYTAHREAATGVWCSPQAENAEPPAMDWIEFFIKTLMENIAEDGSFGVPICSFVNDNCDFTFAPDVQGAE